VESASITLTTTGINRSQHLFVEAKLEADEILLLPEDKEMHSILQQMLSLLLDWSVFARHSATILHKDERSS
jgi:hypothetical protein